MRPSTCPLPRSSRSSRSSRPAWVLGLPLCALLGCAGDDAADDVDDLPITSASQGLSASSGGSTTTAGGSSTTADDGTSSGGDTTTTDASTTAVDVDDDAELVAITLPTSLACGAADVGTITLRNNGITTWSRDAGYRLGAVDDSDPLTAATRVDLPYDVDVTPGDSYSFTVDLAAPEAAALYTSDWRMVREGVGWFGDTAAADVDVSCESDGPPALDLNDVIWLHTDISGWPETMTLESVTFDGGQICMNHSGNDEGVFVWPIELLNGDTEVVGNPWVFIYRDDAWYGATWEWLRPKQTCKAVTSVAGDHIKQSPFDAQSGWTPTSGETLYFMVSALARFPNPSNVSERSNPLKVVWP